MKGTTMENTKLFGFIIASALATSSFALAEDAPVTGAPTTDKAGANYCQNASCKGKSACAAHGNASCAGKNSCKGHGFLKQANAKDCKKAGGKWKKDKA
jgi:hypothetical protein